MINKILRKSLIIIFTVIIVFISVTFSVFRKEIRTILSYKKLNDKPVYMIEVHNNYKLDAYLEVGSTDLSEFQDFLKEELAFGFYKIIEDTFLCSSFTAQTPNGDFIMARNMDANYSPNPVLLTTSPKNSYTAIAMANPDKMQLNSKGEIDFITRFMNLLIPYYCVDGINEHGVSVAILSSTKVSYPKNKGEITLFDYTVPRLILDKASSVREALELLEPYNLFGYPVDTFHYIIADATGDAVVVEYLNGELIVSEKDDDYIVVTNTLLHNNEEKVFRSCSRYSNIHESLDAVDGILSEKDALDLLKENKLGNYKVWSTIFNLTQKKMIIRIDGIEDIYEFSINTDNSIHWEIIDFDSN